MHMKRIRFSLALCAAVALALPALPAAGATPPAPRQGAYYLALGDSLSAGYQPDSAIPWTHGWVYQFQAMLAKRAPIVLTNLAIPGECTGTFIKGGLSVACHTKPVTTPSQLNEAVAYIRYHPGMVNPITVEVGANNLTSIEPAFLGASHAGQQALIGRALAELRRDWTTIFSTLRAACARCEIIAVDQYDPLPRSPVTASVAAALVRYNALLMQVARPFGVRVADVYAPFAGHALQYTWIARGDPHATTTGYTVMARAVARTSGLVR